MRMDDPGAAPAGPASKATRAPAAPAGRANAEAQEVASVSHQWRTGCLCRFGLGCVCVGVRHASSIAQELPLASDHESPHQRRCGVIVSRPFRRVGWKLCTQGRVSPPCHVGGKKSSCCHAPFTRLPARGSRPCGRHTIIGVDSGDGNERLRVIYISGWGRSGTTIVDRLLGQLPGFFSVGELRSLWDSDPSTQLCSCGHTIAECPVWAPSLSGAIGGSTGKEFAAMRSVARSVWTEPRRARSMGLFASAQDA